MGRQIGANAGVNIPLQAAEHYYRITEQIEGISNTWPVIEDPASFGYYPEEVGGLLIGLFEPEAAPWKVEDVPEDFAFGEIPPDWDRMGPYVERAMERVPISKEMGVRKLFCGPESFTPDLQPIVGEAPELKNYFVAAGFELRWHPHRRGPGPGARPLDHQRRARRRRDRLQHRPDAVLSGGPGVSPRPHCGVGWEWSNRVHYPNRSPQTARGAKLSPIHHRLAARGAYFREVSG